MKMFSRIAASAALLLGFAAAAQAIPGLSMDAAVNVAAPSGDFADGSETGFGGAFEAFAGIPLFPLKFGGRVAYNRFGHKFGDGSYSILEVQPSVRYGFGLPLGVFSFFGQFGVGIYNWSSEVKAPGFSVKDSGTDFGVSLGLGANVMNLFLMPMYNVIFDNNDTSYFSFNIGATF
ncbi:MAG: outer membrane beta-barrel protein [Candidatus Latescibacterota bacterium]